jgi:hypothetical protein
LTGWPGETRSTGFHWANSRAGFCLHPDRSQARVGRVPGRPAGPIRVLKHCLQDQNSYSISNPPQGHRHRMSGKKINIFFVFFSLLEVNIFIMFLYYYFQKIYWDCVWFRHHTKKNLNFLNFFYFKIIFSPYFCIIFLIFFCEKYILRLCLNKLFFLF